jgi:hypothetical protein
MMTRLKGGNTRISGKIRMRGRDLRTWEAADGLKNDSLTIFDEDLHTSFIDGH